MKQSKLESLIESIFNTLSGFLLSWFIWVMIVAPYFGIPFDWVSSLGVTAFFTVVSITRNYFVRRFFAREFHIAAANLARRIVGK